MIVQRFALKLSVVAGMLMLPALAHAQEPVIPAQLVASQHTVLSAELPAKIDQFSVKDGESFEEGQSLVRFDCTIHKAALDEARATLSAANKTLAAHRRLLQLNATGRLEVQKATADAAVAQAQVNSASAVVSKCEIMAPFSGRVVAQHVQTYQYVQPGEPLLEILDDSALEAEFIVPSAWIGQLSIGQAITITVDETGKAYPAKILRLGAKVDSVSHSVKVMAGLDGLFPDLMAGMTGKVQVISP